MADEKKKESGTLLDWFTTSCNNASDFLSALDGVKESSEDEKNERVHRVAYGKRQAGEPAHLVTVTTEGEELGPPPVLPPEGARQWLAQRIRTALLASYEREPPVPDIAGARGLEVLRLLVGEAALTSAESAAIWQQCSAGKVSHR